MNQSLLERLFKFALVGLIYMTIQYRWGKIQTGHKDSLKGHQSIEVKIIVAERKQIRVFDNHWLNTG